MSTILIKNGLVIDPANKIKQNLDILIKGNKIAKIDTSLQERNAFVIDVSDKIVTPGLIDLHSHLCDPGFTFRESIKTGTRSAAAGGFTTVFCMPNTDPVIDNVPIATYVRAKSKEEGIVRVMPVGALTKGLQGQELAPIGGMKSIGIMMLSDDENPTMNAEIMRRAMAYNQEFGLVFSVHCEDINISSGGMVRDGFISLKLGVKGIPEIAEITMVSRNILIGQATGTKVHIAHTGTAESIQIIRRAKERGLPVTAEVTPYHFLLNENYITEYDTNLKFYPPLGSADTVKAIEAGLEDGTIDVIATDHNPWRIEDKDVEFDKAPFGAVGFEIAFAAGYTQLVRRGVLSLEDLIAKFTLNPARITGLTLGRLEVGGEADIAIFDLNREWVVDPFKFKSMSKNCPIAGMKLQGVVEATIVNGKLVMHKGEILEKNLPFVDSSSI